MSLDELREYGMEWMDDGEIKNFLSSQGVGVLGLQAEEGPYLLPLSYGYDGESRLYFTYVIGSSSRKQSLTAETETARFLVYKAESMFSWESVLLKGSIEAVPMDQLDDHEAAMENAWRPDLFVSGETSGGVEVYQFEIDEQVGIKHTGLPPGFRRESDETEAD
ncbi:pyridoxamine 5'-phosphate oxidase family protein [Halorientalis brevis]|uniref:Pyridoxamine 5'-phosphate oxidase family protein n=1 Tax=Halorientalis brevis TaxID=1126241 RepID=A0ABD6CBS1_9EURY|nr:pyridoxamine 5'-phosphate oxidase family protein [Halorientalis brevis]